MGFKMNICGYVDWLFIVNDEIESIENEKDYLKGNGCAIEFSDNYYNLKEEKEFIIFMIKEIDRRLLINEWL